MAIASICGWKCPDYEHAAKLLPSRPVLSGVRSNEETRVSMKARNTGAISAGEAQHYISIGNVTPGVSRPSCVVSILPPCFPKIRISLHLRSGTNRFFEPFRMPVTLHIDLWAVLCIFSLLHSLVNSQVCSEEIYGRVNRYDCLIAFNEIPFAQQPVSSIQPRAPRLFAEPQFQIPKFSAVNNILRPQAIVQLPKMWKHSKRNPSQLVLNGCHP